MKVFISWSGQRSHDTAKALGPWLKKVVQSVDYWLSSDMDRGVKWLAEISTSLDEHSFGILCVTPGNKDRPWLLFEAGALSKHLGDGGRVIPYLMDFRSAGDLEEPLAQFNASLADEAGTWELVKTVNKQAEIVQSEGDLKETFDLWWPKLAPQLEAIRAGDPTHVHSPQRSSDEKIDDLLGLVRQLINDQRASHWGAISVGGGALGPADQRAKSERLAFDQERMLKDVFLSITDEVLGKKATRGLQVDLTGPVPLFSLSQKPDKGAVGEIMDRFKEVTGLSAVIGWDDTPTAAGHIELGSR